MALDGKLSSSIDKLLFFCLCISQMDRNECRARHAALRARVTAAPEDMDALMVLMEEYQDLTERMNAAPLLERNMQMQALNAELLSVLMERLTRVFVAACAALTSRRSQ